MDDATKRKKLLLQLQTVRKQTELLCEPLATEDYLVQAMPDVSPIKWHIAHVTWFFEFFLLIPRHKHYQPFNSSYNYLFNSYYESVGDFHARSKRGILSRPILEEIYQYRQYVDQHLVEFLMSLDERSFTGIIPILELGINHEQQHQELILMDIKYNFAAQPTKPAYISISKNNKIKNVVEKSWQKFPSGLYEIGHAGNNFSFDNECPRHTVYLNAYKINNQQVTNAQYLKFIEAGGYQNSAYWLSDGWKTVKKKNWQAPLYWEHKNGTWWNMTLSGLQEVDPEQPVCHVSYYEADAYARFCNARLPSEAEWEIAASYCTPGGNFLESGILQPIATSNDGPAHFFGNVWEWTQSAYTPYPGFRPFEQPFTEYNGKFTCNQFVLRGGCAVTPLSHIRTTYRNFYYPQQRWPNTGIRLANNI